MDTDMVAGIETGLDTVLVLSGVTGRHDISKFPYRPRLVSQRRGLTSPVRSGHKKQKISGAQAPQQEVVFPMNGMKNIDKSTVLKLKEQVAYQPGQVVSRTLAQNDALSVTLFSFDKDEEISTHASGGDAFVTCLDGRRPASRSTAFPTSCTRATPSVMPAGHPTRSTGRSSSRCCWLFVF